MVFEQARCSLDKNNRFGNILSIRFHKRSPINFLLMKKQLIAASAIVGLVSSYVPALAIPTFTPAELSTPGVLRNLFLPGAAENSPVISLGSAIDPQSGKTVDGYAFIHYKPGFSHKPQHSGGSGDTASACYAFIARGARWKATENYLVDPTNTRGLDATTTRDLFAQATNAWDGQVVFDVFGPETAGIVNGADSSSPDGKNEFLFGNVSNQGAIAVTIVWGIFYGPTYQRQLVEWDMVFDDVDFGWSAETAGVAGKMDFLNIAAHEVGHAAGMGHPSDGCTEETMYRFASAGETKKRDLNSGDVAGIKMLYK